MDFYCYTWFAFIAFATIAPDRRIDALFFLNFIFCFSDFLLLIFLLMTVADANEDDGITADEQTVSFV